MIHQVEPSQVIWLLKVVLLRELVESLSIDPHNQPAVGKNFVVGLKVLKFKAFLSDVSSNSQLDLTLTYS